MKKILAVILTIYLSIIIFMPKEQILYTALNQANSQNINFKIDNPTDFGLFENISKLNLLYDTDDVLEVTNAKLFPLLVYNRLSFSHINLVGSFRSMLDIKIIEAKLTQNIISPTTLNIYALSTIGEIEGSFNLKTDILKVILIPNDKFKTFKYKNYFKKTEEGYVYESHIKY